MNSDMDKMVALTERMEQETKVMSENMGTIAAAAEESNVNLGAVATAAGQATESIQAIKGTANNVRDRITATSEAMEQVSSALREIAAQCENAHNESEQADQHSQKNSELMTELTDSSSKVGSVVKTIHNIASQTNLLALNAAIEAAGAGESGKGFAVVANEVKGLAQQTADSTQTIAGLIRNIQGSTNEVSAMTATITEIISRINQSNTAILKSVGVQTGAMSEFDATVQAVAGETGEMTQHLQQAVEEIMEVSRNVQEIAQGVDEVTKSVVNASNGVDRLTPLVASSKDGSWDTFIIAGATAQASIDINKQMEQVTASSKQFTKISREGREMAEELEKVSSGLRQMVRKFKV